MIKKLSSLLIIPFLASCSIKYNPEAIPIARELIFGAQDIKIDSNYFANEKASFAKIQFGRSYIIIPALTSVGDEDIAKWETVSDEAIYTQNGKILSIAGFDHDVFVTGFKSLKFNKDNPIKRAFNISLNSEYEGGEIKFIKKKKKIKNKKGYALIHPGRITHYHEGLPVTMGNKYICVSFVN